MKVRSVHVKASHESWPQVHGQYMSYIQNAYWSEVGHQRLLLLLSSVLIIYLFFGDRTCVESSVICDLIAPSLPICYMKVSFLFRSHFLLHSLYLQNKARWDVLPFCFCFNQYICLHYTLLGFCIIHAFFFNDPCCFLPSVFLLSLNSWAIC